MAVTTRVDMFIPQGSTYVHTFTYVDADETAINITDYTARMHIRENVDSSDTIYEASSTTGELVITGIEGEVELTISATDTAGFTFTTAVYDIEIVSPDDEVIRLVKGKVKLDKEVTR